MSAPLINLLGASYTLLGQIAHCGECWAHNRPTAGPQQSHSRPTAVPQLGHSLATSGPQQAHSRPTAGPQLRAHSWPVAAHSSRPATGRQLGRQQADSWPTAGPQLAHSCPTAGPQQARSWAAAGPQQAHSWPKAGPQLSHSSRPAAGNLEQLQMPRQEKDESGLLKHVRLFAGPSQGQCHSGIVSGLPAVGHPILPCPPTICHS
jgi:hypothetical protein